MLTTSNSLRGDRRLHVQRMVSEFLLAACFALGCAVCRLRRRLSCGKNPGDQEGTTSPYAPPSLNQTKLGIRPSLPSTIHRRMDWGRGCRGPRHNRSNEVEGRDAASSL